MLNLVNMTIESNWPLLFVSMMIIIIMRFSYYKANNKKIFLYQEFYNFIFFIYIFILSSIISYSNLNSFGGTNYIPFKEILRHEIGSELFTLNVVGNILLFIPLGFFIGYYIKTNKIYFSFIISFGVSLFAEVLQKFNGRNFDIDDVILNVLGAVIGYAVYKILLWIYKKLPSFMRKDGLYNVLCIIILFVMLLYVLSVIGVINIL